MKLRAWATAAVASLTAGLFALAAAPALADGAQASTEHVQAELAPETAAAAPGSTVYVALRQKIAPGWHTYWRNPGDSGQPTSIDWTLPAGWKAGDIVWPAPEHVATGPLMNYVYSGEVVLPVPIAVPASARPGQHVALKAAVDWLVCKDVCVPEQATLTLDLPIAAGTPAQDPRLGREIAETLAAAPKPSGDVAHFRAQGPDLTLTVTGADLSGADVAHAWFYPYDGTAIDHAKPEQVARGPQGLTFKLAAGYAFQHGPALKTLAGVIVLGPGKAFEVTAQPGAPLAGAAGLTPLAPSAPGGGPGETAATGEAASGLLPAIAAAFIGGLILNLMPCVFPVLAIKGAAFARHVAHPGRARAEGLAYLAGVVVTFVGLAAALIALKAAGQAAGWGFQLQSPGVVAALTLLLLLVALNLSGVFEIGGSVQGAGSGLADRGGLVGAVFTGVLAVVVAAPCTAPFMAGAIGWAATQPPLADLAVFLALGLGLAAPLTALAFAPGLFQRLPRPGPWMEGLRKLLAFPMYGTAAWLAWVFVVLTDVNALPLLFAAAVALAFAAWLWGAAQRGATPLLARGAAVVAALVAVPLAWTGASQAAAPTAGASAQTASTPSGAALSAQPWSAEKVAELTGQGHPVFVDFTAAWCVTCQVNERTALAGKGVADAFARTGAVYLKADWTRRDATIAQALSAQGRSGVPLYLVYAPGGAAPKVLPQLLSEGAVVQALETAAKRPA